MSSGLSSGELASKSSPKPNINSHQTTSLMIIGTSSIGIEGSFFQIAALSVFASIVKH